MVDELTLDQDARWMAYALELAQRGAAHGEAPIGAVK